MGTELDRNDIAVELLAIFPEIDPARSPQNLHGIGHSDLKMVCRKSDFKCTVFQN